MFLKTLILSSVIFVSAHAGAGLGVDPQMSIGGAQSSRFSQTNLNGTTANGILPGLAAIASALAGAAPSSEAWFSPSGTQPLATNTLFDPTKSHHQDDGSVSQ